MNTNTIILEETEATITFAKLAEESKSS